jgi:hypothetical protein
MRCVYIAMRDVQGEYPLASASAVERSETSSLPSGAAPERGKAVVLTFSMQGVFPIAECTIKYVFRNASN